MSHPSPETPLLTTPLDALHRSLGAKMVPFAGYDMPVNYPQGILGEHLHTRAAAGLFDVSHMGQVELRGPDVSALLETLVPGDVQGLGIGRTRYSVLTNDQGGILDDLMISKLAEDHLYLVVNAACKHADLTHLTAALGHKVSVRMAPDRGLMALQGPQAALVLGRLAPETQTMPFMSIRDVAIAGIPCRVTRSGYTGEDGFEISVAANQAETLARLLLGQPEAAPIGLGARDSLRLEAGLCLYGNDIDTTTTPIEAGLAWIIGKRRREQGGFPGADVILSQLRDGTIRRRVGIQPFGRAPARAHTEIVDSTGTKIGEITSGGFGPSAQGPVAMGYVPAAMSQPGTTLSLVVRGNPLAAQVVALPFVAHRYFKA